MATYISSLAPNQVFVFGSNSMGFHGAGAAGFACRGDYRNNWRDDTWFLDAKESPIGSPARIGKWAVYGVAAGFQEGREGKSYAIMTTVGPGRKRSVPLSEIEEQLIEMFEFAEKHPDLEFLMTPIGSRLAGYTSEEMLSTLNNAIESKKPPKNVVIPDGIYK